jgi:hypothetical protein
MLTATEYYNLVHKSKLKTELRRQNIEGLLITLQEKGFIYRCRVDNEVDLSGSVISRKLVQIVRTCSRIDSLSAEVLYTRRINLKKGKKV